MNWDIITRNAVRCNECKHVIESTYRHDFKFCPCGNIAVDGGHEYIRRIGLGLDTPDSYVELSEGHPSVDIPQLDNSMLTG